MSSVAFYVTAHQDDWELFRGYQAYVDIEQTPADTKIVFIYTTAGDAGREDDYWERRELGALRAQACALNRMQQPNNYHLLPDVFIANGHQIARFQQARVVKEPIKVVSYHMRLPDGHKLESLQNLHQNGQPITAIGQPTTTYTSWNDFCSTVGAILEHETAQTTSPNPWVNAADWNEQYNPEDHVDHRETALALQAVYQATNNKFHRAWFRTYCTRGLPMNMDGARLMRKRAVYTEYASAAGDEAQEWADYGPKDYCRTVPAGQSE
jgi:hypothetical protein